MRIILILFLLTVPCYAGQMTVTTGYGYFMKDGHITDKSILPAGSHPIKNGYTYTEVASEQELNAIQIYVPPLTSDEQKKVVEAQIEKLHQQILEAMIDNDTAKINTLKSQRNALKLQLTPAQIKGHVN